MEKLKQMFKWGKENEVILKALVFVSLILLTYNFVYLFNYYTRSDIFLHTPNIVDSDKAKLDPNEIGDSIGGILNPLIGFTACILTFLAFYIQYRANNMQREIFNIELENEKTKSTEKEKKKEHEIAEEHKTNVRLMYVLFVTIHQYYRETGANIKSFIDLEKNRSLELNQYTIAINRSYETFQKLDIAQIFKSVIFHFKGSKLDWETDFINTLNIFDFYNVLVEDMKVKFESHRDLKIKSFSSIGRRLQIVLEQLLEFKEVRELKSVERFSEIVFGFKKGDNNFSLDNIPVTSYENLYNEFIPEFYKELSSLNLKTPFNSYNEHLKAIKDINTDLANEKVRVLLFLKNIDKQYLEFFLPNNKSFKLIEDFIEKIKK